jgi:predicted DsbA family dithiol-disulfide isomerase
MSTSKNIKLKHFSDILCIWAYIGQIRLDKLKTKFSDDIEIDYHFIQVFGTVEKK